MGREKGALDDSEENARILNDLNLAEREGFEPSVEFPLHTLSKRAPSTTRPSLHFRINELRAARHQIIARQLRLPSVSRS